MPKKIDGSMKSSIPLRGLSQEAMEIMTMLAAKNDRSLEAEFRHAVHQYVEPIRLQREFARNRCGLAQRLHGAHLTFLERHPEHSPKLSHVAQAIGEERSGHVEEWFDGVSSPPFSALDKLSSYFGCSSAWLTHGDGEPYEEADPTAVIVSPGSASSQQSA